MSVFEEERAVALVVFLVEGPPGDEDAESIRRLRRSVPRGGQVKRVEEHREGGVSLCPVLRAQAEQHDMAGTHVDRHDRRTTNHELFAFQPA